MHSADPFGSFTLRNVPCVEAGEPQPLRLFVGPWEEDTQVERGLIAPDDYVAHALGWVALGRRGCGLGPRHSGPATVAAAALAACVGAADLFKRAIGHHRSEWIGDYSWCTWSHDFSSSALARYEPRPVPSEHHLGSVLLAGVGAIGSALAYLADFMPLRGRLMLLDRDRIETSNLNRSPLFTAWDVLADAVKTDSVLNYLSRHEGLRLATVMGTWAENGARLAREGFDVWVSLTNEDGAWAQVPFQLPPIVLHGTTTSGWGFGAGRHIPRLDDCTMCRLPRPAAEFRGPCAEGDIGGVIAPVGARASLPFLSAASAALILAELLKIGAPEYPLLPNDVSADLRYGLPAVIAVTRVPTEGCEGCRASRTKLWESRGGAGRYRPYSEAA
ncbi:MAG TPA: ThiF family adenylyltransferase [Pyrinomonadaceae bacterium]